MIDGSFQDGPSGDDSNQLLQELAKEAQQHPHQSSQRGLALNKLVNEIWKSDRLGHPQRGVWSPGLYENLYNEALQITLLEVCQKIDNYNPEYPVMAWVNFLLKNRFINVVNHYNKQGVTHKPKGQTTPILSLDDLDNHDKHLPESEEAFTDAHLLQQFLKDDPENLLKTEQLSSHPEISFQLLAWAKFVEDKTWKEISQNLGISTQTLTSFFYRRLQKMIPYFRKYLQDYSNQHMER